MQELKYTITDPLGIHARPAGLLVKEASKFTSKITLDTGTKQVDAKRIMAVMSAGAKQGTNLVIQAEGEDENEAIKAIAGFLETNL